MVLSVRRATFKRWLNLSSGKYSLLRALEYEAIKGIKLKGRTLDIGGGGNNSYYDLLKIEGIIESVDIDPARRSTILADINKPLPFNDQDFDHVISLNTFEHILNDDMAINESIRVLKAGGTFHFLVPFLYKIHGAPNDYHRHTSEWWLWKLNKNGISEKNIIIEPLVWCPHTSAFSLAEFRWSFRRPFKGILNKKLLMLVAVFKHLRWLHRERLPEKVSAFYSNFAVGYYITGIKQ